MESKYVRIRNGRARVFIAFLAVTLVAAPIGAEDAEEAEHEALRDLKALFEKAVNENDLELLRPHFDDGYSVVTFTNREFTDFDHFKSEWQKSREKFLQGGTYQVTLLPERSQIIDNIAITRGDSENVLVTGSGSEYQFSSRWTGVLRRVDGNWMIARVHSSMNPFDNPMVVAGARKKVIQFAIGGSVLGCVVGWLLCRLISRRPAGTASK